MSLKSASRRFTTLDFLRGYFLFIIIVDHVELYPSGFDFLTGRGRLWVSAAEGFFFISGLLVAYIYRRKLAKGLSFGKIWQKMWQRAGWLYLCSIFFTLLFTYWAVHAGATDIKYGLPAVMHWPQIIVDTLTLQYSFGWADFLPHYVVFLLAAPFVFYLLTKGKWWVVVPASILVWTQRGQEGFDLAWQTIFFGGMIIGYYWEAITSFVRGWQPGWQRRARYGLYAAAGITFAVSYLGAYLLPELEARTSALSVGVAAFTANWHAWNEAIWPVFEKWTMEPGRILTFSLWFAAAYVWCEMRADRIRQLTRGAFEVLGRQSLFVYGLHAVVIFVLHLAVQGQTAVWQNVVLTGGVLAFIWLVTYAKDNLAVIGKRRPALPTAQPDTTLTQLIPAKKEQE